MHSLGWEGLLPFFPQVAKFCVLKFCSFLPLPADWYISKCSLWCEECVIYADLGNFKANHLWICVDILIPFLNSLLSIWFSVLWLCPCQEFQMEIQRQTALWLDSIQANLPLWQHLGCPVEEWNEQFSIERYESSQVLFMCILYIYI